MSVTEAVGRDLEALRLRAGAVADSALAASALVLARELDDLASQEECEECGHVQSWTTGRNSATSKSMCAKALRETMDRLAELAPASEEADQLDELSAARAARRASGA